MSDLTEFLLARLAEDAETAKRAAFGWGTEWTSETDDVEEWSVVHADGKRDMVGCEDGDVTRHIACHDPTRVLAECEAKRRIVALYVEAQAAEGAAYEAARDYLECALRALALLSASHEEYRSEWAS